jgi:hypothetical protein
MCVYSIVHAYACIIGHYVCKHVCMRVCMCMCVYSHVDKYMRQTFVRHTVCRSMLASLLPAG